MNQDMVVCNCGAQTIIKTSWTSQNPACRFHCCNRAGRTCGFVSWAEPPMNQNPAVIIPALSDTIRRHEENAREMAYKISLRDQQARTLARQNRVMKILLGCTWLFVVMYYICR
ncbi:putative transcription factor GRF family [Helianthus annuus]|nr:putative transcription factor GRF family [Helianthus annuus]